MPIKLIDNLEISESNERALLASIIKNRDERNDILYVTSENLFNKFEYKNIFKSFIEINNKGQNIDKESVLPLISGDIGTTILFDDLLNIDIDFSDYSRYIDVLKEKMCIRRLKQISENISNNIKENKSSSEIIDSVHNSTVNIENINQTEKEHISDILSENLPDINNLIHKNILGFSTGLDQLDKITSGLQRQHFIVIGGRPSTGKTLLALQFVVNSIEQCKYPSLIISIETTKNQILNRIISNITNINLTTVKTRSFSDNEKLVLKQKYDYIKNAPIIICDDPIMTLSKITSKCKRYIHLYGGLSYVVVDYIQLIKGNSQNKNQDLENISQGLKILSKQINVPIIGISQLSRGIEFRGDDWTEQPKLSDLRSSGGIEQAADEVIMITAKSIEKLEYYKGRDSIIWVVKQKDGPLGSIKSVCKGNICKFIESTDKIKINDETQIF